MGFKTNLYKIPHLSTMTYEDIKNFEKNGITPQDSIKIKGADDGQQTGPADGTSEDLLG